MSAPTATHTDITDLSSLQTRVRAWGRELGFSAIGFASVELGEAEDELMDWLAAGYHGSMDYMARHGVTRARPAELLPGTVSIISARLDYLPPASRALGQPGGFTTRLSLPLCTGARLSQADAQPLAATGRTSRRRSGRLQLSRLFRQRAGAGSHACTQRRARLARQAHADCWTVPVPGSFSASCSSISPSPADAPVTPHCGTCQACIDICPTQAILAPYTLDARRCISYLTIEHAGPIPLELRPLLGNRIYGCDDCQLACPWNSFAQVSNLPDFLPRHRLDSASLLELFAWSEAEFLQRLEGSAIRRIGHERWLRNIAVALGNALRQLEASPGRDAVAIIAALQARADHPSAQLREHLQWALSQSRQSKHD
jgi:epoxyqueuosine reductase